MGGYVDMWMCGCVYVEWREMIIITCIIPLIIRV